MTDKLEEKMGIRHFLHSWLALVFALLLNAVCVFLFAIITNKMLNVSRGSMGEMMAKIMDTPGQNYMLISACISFLLNIFCLGIIPAAGRPLNPKTKQMQFIGGFIANIVIPVLAMILYSFVLKKITPETILILMAFHFIIFLCLFLFGRFGVTKTYRPYFWFKYYYKNKKKSKV
jgi:hypothetical protein